MVTNLYSLWKMSTFAQLVQIVKSSKIRGRVGESRIKIITIFMILPRAQLMVTQKVKSNIFSKN